MELAILSCIQIFLNIFKLSFNTYVIDFSNDNILAMNIINIISVIYQLIDILFFIILFWVIINKKIYENVLTYLKQNYIIVIIGNIVDTALKIYMINVTNINMINYNYYFIIQFQYCICILCSGVILFSTKPLDKNEKLNLI